MPSTPPTSRLAIASVACAAVLCCPLTSIVGMFLGILAMHRIRIAGGALGGRWLAVGGTLLASASLVVQAGLIERYRASLDERIQTEIAASARALVTATQDGDVDAFRAAWIEPDRGEEVGDDDIRSFGTSTRERYGALTDVRVVSHSLGGGAYEATAALIFTFEHGPQTGSGRFRFTHDGFDWFETARAAELTVDDLQQEVLSLPPGAASGE